MSVRDEVVNDLITACAGIRDEYGFATDVKQVYPYFADPAQHPAVLVVEGAERVEYLAYPLAHRFLIVEVWGVHRVRTSMKDRPDQVARSFIADIERAVLADPTRAGKAQDTTLQGSEVVAVSSDELAVRVDFEIKYRTRLDEPSQVI